MPLLIHFDADSASIPRNKVILFRKEFKNAHFSLNRVRYFRYHPLALRHC
jgi:hypothetical protein